MTRPATDGRTFAVRPGSASTTAGNVRLRWIFLSATSAIPSLVRNGEVGGTVIRAPSTVKNAAVSWSDGSWARRAPLRDAT